MNRITETIVEVAQMATVDHGIDLPAEQFLGFEYKKLYRVFLLTTDSNSFSSADRTSCAPARHFHH